MTKFLKQPSESWLMAFEFAGELPPGATLTGGTVSAVRLDTGVTDNSVLVSTTLIIVGTQAQFTPQAGVAGIDYKITGVVTLNIGGSLEEDVTMEVRNL
jgi:hypothetical protein